MYKGLGTENEDWETRVYIYIRQQHYQFNVFKYNTLALYIYSYNNNDTNIKYYLQSSCITKQTTTKLIRHINLPQKTHVKCIIIGCMYAYPGVHQIT